MENNRTAAFLKQRKFLMIIPLLVLPFITLGFWSLGGGQQAAPDIPLAKGFNNSLPGVHLKEDKTRDKMSYYAQAALDSAKLKELKKSDPYYQPISSKGLVNTDEQRLGFKGEASTSTNTEAYQLYANNDPNEQKVYQKLDQLNAALAATPPEQKDEKPAFSPNLNTGLNSKEVDRLEQMMLAMQQDGGEDPEMKQLDGMLEKIIRIQNPGLAQEKLRKLSEAKKGLVFAVTANKKPEPISSLDEGATGQRMERPSSLKGTTNGFYSLDQSPSEQADQNAIEAVVHETQTIVSGSTVKLRLSNEIYINGQLIPKGSFITGIASLNGERLNVKINNVRFGNSLYPVELSVFDLDGIEGIYIPGAISRDVAKQSADRGLQNIGFNSISPSIEMQAAGVGVEAAKSLFSKKAKLIRVSVKAGYAVLLRDEKQKQQN